MPIIPIRDPIKDPVRKIYVASSWRNTIQPDVVQWLRAAGHEVYDFRNPAPGNTGFAWEQVDPEWKTWDPAEFAGLVHMHPVAKAGFKLDKDALDWCDTCVLVLPCGRSAHLEAGYAAGQGKDVVFFLRPDGFEPELMYELGNGYVTNATQLTYRMGLPIRRGNDHFQEACVAWAVEAFTPLDVGLVSSVEERLDRVAEEEIELLQAASYPRERAHAMVDHVYDTKDPGAISQEIAGVGVTVALLAAALGVSRSHAELDELARVQRPEIMEKVRNKRLSKPSGDELMRGRRPPPADNLPSSLDREGMDVDPVDRAPPKLASPEDGFRCPRRDEGFMAMQLDPNAIDVWRNDPVRTCSYCGSVHPDEFMAHWEKGGSIHGTDKGYKAYPQMPGQKKFYFQHLSDKQKMRFIELMNEGKGKWLYVKPYFVTFVKPEN